MVEYLELLFAYPGRELGQSDPFFAVRLLSESRRETSSIAVHLWTLVPEL